MNISNIGQYEIDYDGLDKLEEEERKVANYILQDGDVLLPARGTAIRTAVFREQSYPVSYTHLMGPGRKRLFRHDPPSKFLCTLGKGLGFPRI